MPKTEFNDLPQILQSVRTRPSFIMRLNVRSVAVGAAPGGNRRIGLVPGGSFEGERECGSIVNLSSTMGSRGAAGASMYVASKHAVEGLTKSAALEAAPYGVRVNAVAPDLVDTELLSQFAGGTGKIAALTQGVPLKRIGTPEEIAQVIVFLASDKANFVTGEIVHINGGKTAL